MVCLDYIGPGGVGYDEYRERLVIEHVESNDYMVRTHTYDIFVETCSRRNPDVADF